MLTLNINNSILKVPKEEKEEDFRKIDIKIEAKEPEIEPAAEDIAEVILYLKLHYIMVRKLLYMPILKQ